MTRPGNGHEGGPQPSTITNIVSAVVANRAASAELAERVQLGNAKLTESMPLIASVLRRYKPVYGQPLTARGAQRPGKGFKADLPTPDGGKPIRVNVLVHGYNDETAPYLFKALEVEVPELKRALVVRLVGPRDNVRALGEIGEFLGQGEDGLHGAELPEVNDFVEILGELAAGRVVTGQGVSLLTRERTGDSMFEGDAGEQLREDIGAIDRTLRRPGVLD
jgi:hypothetical protein